MQQDYINLLRLSVAQLATKYANDFTNDFPRWPADYLEPAQLSQWHTLPMSQVKVSIHFTAGRPSRWALPRILVLKLITVGNFRVETLTQWPLCIYVKSNMSVYQLNHTKFKNCSYNTFWTLCDWVDTLICYFLPRDASAECGNATVSRLSVCPSVCPSVRPWRLGISNT